MTQIQPVRFLKSDYFSRVTIRFYQAWSYKLSCNVKRFALKMANYSTFESLFLRHFDGSHSDLHARKFYELFIYTRSSTRRYSLYTRDNQNQKQTVTNEKKTVLSSRIRFKRCYGYVLQKPHQYVTYIHNNGSDHKYHSQAPLKCNVQ